MKLSEACQLGEFSLPKHKGWWTSRDLYTNQVCGGCAVTRACYAAGFHMASNMMSDEKYELDSFMLETWPWIRDWKPQFPCATPIDIERSWRTTHISKLMCTMSILYEFHNWSLPQIGRWVETFEPQDAQETSPMLNYDDEACITGANSCQSR